MNSPEKIVCIGGGVGPMAGVGLHKLVIENTLTDGTDQTHLETLHLSRSNDVLDRTRFLLGEIDENPAEGMARTIEMAEKAAGLAGKEMVAGVPCNTFHAPAIFNRFLESLEEKGLKTKILHMLNETAELVDKLAPGAKTLGLMSTTGTRQVGVYRQILEPKGYTIVEVPETMQSELHESIYHPEWGIKAVSPVSARARENFVTYLRTLKDAGAEAVILGCTEIPLALPEKRFDDTPLIDPMLALARALIREAARDKLKPLLA